MRNGTAIAGQVGSTYTLQSEDGGTAIACQVTATNAAGAVVATSGSVQVSIQTPEKSKANTEGKANTVPPRKGVAVVSTIKRGSNGDLSVALRCKRDGACKGTLKVSYKTVGRVYGSKHQVKRFMHVVLLGSVKFSLSAGGHRTLKLHLTRKGKALLGARMQHSLKLSVSGNDVRSRKLVLKA